MNKIYRNSLLLIISLTFGFLFAFACISYYGDSGYYYSQSKKYEELLANALVTNNVLVCNNYNDRRLKKRLIQQIKVPLDVLILGSSRTMVLTHNLFNTNQFFNASVTSASLEDDIALYYLYQLTGYQPKLIVIGLDPWIINNLPSNWLWETVFLEDYTLANQTLLGNKHYSLTFYQKIHMLLEKYSQLFSPYYFSDSFKKILVSRKKYKTNEYPGDLLINPNNVILKEFSTCHLHLSDGTRLTSFMENMTSGDQADYTGEIEAHRIFPETYELNYQKAKLFEQFIQYLVKKHIRIIFYLPPYEPAAYREMHQNLLAFNIDRTEQYSIALAKKYQIKVIGSYNPNMLHLSSNDFIDDIHLKKESIDKLFAYL